MRNFVKFLEIAEAVVGAAAFLGVIIYFHGCGKHNDVYPSCHWANNVILALLVLLIVHALLSLLMPAGRLKAGISIAMVPTALLISIIPGFIIPLCVGRNMACISKLKPFSIITGLVIAALALIHTLFAILSSRPADPEKNAGGDIRMATRRREREVPRERDVPEPYLEEWDSSDVR